MKQLTDRELETIWAHYATMAPAGARRVACMRAAIAADREINGITGEAQPAQAMQRWQIMPTVRVRSTNQELSVTGVYEDVVFVDLPEQPAASKPEPQAQAGEPEWTENERNAHLFLVADRASWLANNFDGTQEHYDEAIAKLRDYAALILELREAIAKKDAALAKIKNEAVSLADAQVIALEALK